MRVVLGPFQKSMLLFVLVFCVLVTFVTCVVFWGMWRFRDWLVWVCWPDMNSQHFLPANHVTAAWWIPQVPRPSTQIRESHPAFGSSAGSLHENLSAPPPGHGEALQRASGCRSAISAPENWISTSPHPHKLSICEVSSLEVVQSSCYVSFFWSPWLHLESGVLIVYRYLEPCVFQVLN